MKICNCGALIGSVVDSRCLPLSFPQSKYNCGQQVHQCLKHKLNPDQYNFPFHSEMDQLSRNLATRRRKYRWASKSDWSRGKNWNYLSCFLLLPCFMHRNCCYLCRVLQLVTMPCNLDLGRLSMCCIHTLSWKYTLMSFVSFCASMLNMTAVLYSWQDTSWMGQNNNWGIW